MEFLCSMRLCASKVVDVGRRAYMEFYVRCGSTHLQTYDPLHVDSCSLQHIHTVNLTRTGCQSERSLGESAAPPMCLVSCGDTQALPALNDHLSNQDIPRCLTCCVDLCEIYQGDQKARDTYLRRRSGRKSTCLCMYVWRLETCADNRVALRLWVEHVPAPIA